MTSFLLCALLAMHSATSGQPAPLSGEPDNTLTVEQIQSSVRSYLGTIDTPIEQTRWKRLGVRAEPVLLEIINGKTLPSRRAKAIDGLSIIGGPSAKQLCERISADENETLNVRLAAIRGLARVTTDGALLAALRPLLEKSQNASVRSLAGEQLAKRIPSEACPLVRAQVAREASEVQGEFGRAVDACFAR